MSLHLFVSCDGYDDMDLFVNIQKASEDGTWVPWLTLDEPHPGAWGKCRVSRATVDAGLTKKHTPVYTMTDTHKLEDGEVRAVSRSPAATSAMAGSSRCRGTRTTVAPTTSTREASAPPGSRCLWFHRATRRGATSTDSTWRGLPPAPWGGEVRESSLAHLALSGH